MWQRYGTVVKNNVMRNCQVHCYTREHDTVKKMKDASIFIHIYNIGLDTEARTHG